MATKRENLPPTGDLGASPLTVAPNPNLSADSSTLPLSRNALYTPLVAYEQDRVEPSAYMASRKNKKLPKSLHEASLSKFLESVSLYYHRHGGARVNDAKNNGSRPLTAVDMDDRLRQRAIALVGDGMFISRTSSGNNVNNNTTKSSNKRPKPSVSPQQSKKCHVSNRQRKKRILACSKKSSSTLSQPSTVPTLSKETEAATYQHDDNNYNNNNGKDLIFLQKMNVIWNDYIGQLVAIHPRNNSSNVITSIFEKNNDVSSVLENAELVGARVRIKQCPAQRHWVGCEGFLVGMTANTWNVSILQPTNKGESKPPPGQDNPTITLPSDNVTVRQKIAVVPKRGSIITVRLPLNTFAGDMAAAETTLLDSPQRSFLCVDIEG